MILGLILGMGIILSSQGLIIFSCLPKMDTHFDILSNQPQPNQHVFWFFSSNILSAGRKRRVRHTQGEKSVLKLRRLEPTAGHTSGTEGRQSETTPSSLRNARQSEKMQPVQGCWAFPIVSHSTNAINRMPAAFIEGITSNSLCLWLLDTDN